MVERSGGRIDPDDGGYGPGTPEFGDEESGGLAAEPSDLDTADPNRVCGAEQTVSGTGDLAGTPTGDLGGGSAEDVAQDRDIDRDLNG